MTADGRLGRFIIAILATSVIVALIFTAVQP
jgi:hypothetical protein